MGSGLGGPPNPQLQGRREEGRTWQSWEKGGGPSNDSTHHPPKHTRTHTTVPFSSPTVYKNSKPSGCFQAVLCASEEEGGGSKVGRGMVRIKRWGNMHGPHPQK